MVVEEMEKNSISGVAVAIAVDGKLLYSKGFGYADLENKVPFTAQTVSRIGSISKTFTALSVMQLVEKYSYTTYGYNLLSRAIEVASGEAFTDYVRRHIIDPLGMKQTYCDEPSKIIPGGARFYTRSNNTGPVINVPQVDQSNNGAAACFRSRK